MTRQPQTRYVACCGSFFCMPVVFVLLLYAAQDNVQLRWKLAAGDRFHVAFKQATKINSQVNRRTRIVSNDVTLEMDWEVSNVDENGTATIEQTITRVAATMTTPAESGQKTTVVDTAGDEKHTGLAKDLLLQVRPLVSARCTIVMTSRGAIERVSIPEPTLEALRNVPGSMQLRQLLTESGLKEVFGQSAIVLPEEGVRPGDSWDMTQQIDSPLGKFDRNHEITYAGPTVESGRSLDQLTIKTTVGPGQATDKSSESTLLEFSGNGTMLFDRQSGFFASSKIKNQLKTERPYRDMTIQTSVSNDITMDVQKK